MAKATLTIASKNYGSWSLRGWLLASMIGGKSVTATTRAQARELLEVAQAEFKRPSAAAKGSRRRRAS